MSSLVLRARRCAPLAIGLAAACASSTPKTAPASGNGTVTADQIQQSPGGDPIEKVLAARSPGVTIGRAADGGISVRIRGGSSLMGNNEPLYIVDGSPFLPGAGGSLTGLNPYDIESIKVLKDPADLTMYGSRGANGVIVIKTKQKR